MQKPASKFFHRASLLGFIIIVFGPLAALTLETTKSILIGHHREWLPLVIPSGRTLQLLCESVLFAVTVSLMGMALGVLVALILWRWHNILSAYLRWLIVLLFPIPAYVHILAWFSLAPGLSGWLGSWWIEVVTLLPLAVALALVGFYSISPVLIEASRINRAGMPVLFRVALPLAAPAIIAGAGFIFVLSITDYSVPSLFSKSVYSLEIFSEFSASSVAAKAFLLSVPLLFIASLVIISSQAAIRNATLHIARKAPDISALKFPVWFNWLQALAAAVVVSAVFVPMTSLVLSVGSLRQIASTVAAAKSEIIFSLTIAAASAFFCLPLAWAAAEELVSEKRTAYLWWLAVVLPLAIPGSLVGIGLISMYNKEALATVYGSSWMPVLAMMARFTPFAALILMAQLKRVDRSQLDAVQLFQRNSLQGWWNVKLALFGPGIFAAGFVVFALTLGELGATLIVAPPGKATLSMRIYNFMHYGASREVAGLCLVIALMVLAAAGAAIRIFKER